MANLRMFTSMSDSGINSGLGKMINNLKKFEQQANRSTNSLKKIANTKIKPFTIAIKDTVSKSIRNIKSKLATLSGKVVKVSVDAKDYATKTAGNINKKLKKMLRSAHTIAIDAKDKASVRIAGIKLALDGLNTKAKNAAKSISDSMNKIDFKGVNSKVNGLISIIGKGFVTAAKTATAAIVGIGTALGTAVKQSISEFGDYEQILGGVKTLFGVDDLSLEQYAKRAGKSIADVTDEYKRNKEAQDLVMKNAKEAFKYSGMSANEYMNTVNTTSASMIQSLGGDTLKAAEVSDIMLKDISDNVNKLGTDMGMVSYAYTGFARGQFLMLDNLRLGYQGTQSEMERLLKDAEEFSGIKYDINSYADIVQAIHVIQEKMKITGTTTEEAEKTIQGSMRMMKSSWKDLMTAFVLGGEDLDRCFENVIYSVKAFASNALPAADKALTNILKLLGPIGKSIQRVIDKIKAFAKDSKKVEKVKNIVNGLKTALEKVVDAAAMAIEKIIDFATSEKSLNAVETAVKGINTALDWCKDNWDTVKLVITDVIAVIAGLKLTNFLLDLNKAIIKAGGLKGIIESIKKKSGAISLALGVTLAITGITMEVDGIKDTLKEGLNLNNLGEIIGGGGTLAAGGALIGKALGSALLGGAIGGIVAGIPAFITGVWDAIKNGIDGLSALLIGAGATATGAGIGAIIGMVGGPIGAGIGALIGLAVGLVTDLVILVVQKWDEICAWCKEACNKIGQFFSNLWTDICEFFAPVGEFFSNAWNTIKESAISAWNSICEFFSTIGTWIYDNVISPVVTFFTNAFYFIVGIAAYVWEGICWVWGIIAPWVYENVIAPVVNFFTGLWQSICDIVSNVWNWICVVWSVISTWVYTTVILPIVNFFTSLWQSICNIVSSVWNWICQTWGLISGWVSANIITPVVGFFTGLWQSICDIVSNVWNWICEVWGQISGWVSSSIVEPVKSFFSGLWDTITSAVNGVKDAITGAFQSAWDTVTGLWSGITDFFSGLWDGISDWVNKVIGKGKEALGVSNDVKGKKAKEHAWGGLITKPHLGLVGEAGPEMIIPLSNNKRNRGENLWQQAGRIMGIIPYQDGGIVGSFPRTINNSETENVSGSRLDSLIGTKREKSKGGNNDNRSYHFGGMIGEVHIHNEADEDRFIAKLKKVLEDEVFGGGDTVYD